MGGPKATSGGVKLFEADYRRIRRCGVGEPVNDPHDTLVARRVKSFWGAHKSLSRHKAGLGVAVAEEKLGPILSSSPSSVPLTFL